MRITPHLNFNGQCRAAFERYRAVLGGSIQIMLSYGESPLADTFDARWHDRILHASLVFGDAELIGTDQFPDGYLAPQGIFITVNVPGVDKGREVFDGLAAGGRITLPFASTFWSPGFGVLVDAFGITWEVNSAASET
jgi:PhnB protein